MIITNFNNWNGYQFGNKIIGLNNLIQISKFYNQDYFFTEFNGLELFEVGNKTREYNKEQYEILDVNFLIKNKFEVSLDNDKIYYLEPSLLEYFYEFSTLSTYDIFKYKNIDLTKKNVAIHFRGGDFHQWDPKSILPFEYYKNSIDFVRSEINEEDYNYILFSDDTNLESYIKTIEYLNFLNIGYSTGNVSNFKEDFTKISECKYVISSPSTFVISASFCGNKNKKIIHSYDWVVNYKNNSDYFRDVFWKELYRNGGNNDYKFYKLI